eukprot:jgi/Chlat1/1575/Chrsp123S01851
MQTFVHRNLQNNHFYGPLPSTMGNMINLEELFLNDNRLSGPLPSSLSNLVLVQTVYLHNNINLCGSFPAFLQLPDVVGYYYSTSLGNGSPCPLPAPPPSPTSPGDLAFTALKDLQAAVSWTDGNGNKVDGIPNWTDLGASPDYNICTLPGITCQDGMGITQVNLQGNHFYGPLPSSMGNMINLEELRFGINQFTGPLPSTMGNWIKLRLLFLNDNQLSGPVPSTLSNLNRLQLVYLHNNANLCGKYPASLQQYDVQGYYYNTKLGKSCPLPSPPPSNSPPPLEIEASSPPPPLPSDSPPPQEDEAGSPPPPVSD